MKRKVVLTIKCGDKTCERCDWLLCLTCSLFEQGLKHEHQDGGAARCRACLAAEAKAKGGGK